VGPALRCAIDVLMWTNTPQRRNRAIDLHRDLVVARDVHRVDCGIAVVRELLEPKTGRPWVLQKIAQLVIHKAARV